MLIEGRDLKLQRARTVRLPRDIADALQRAADMNYRTWNMEVVLRLHQSFKRPTIELVQLELEAIKTLLAKSLKKPLRVRPAPED